MSIEVPQPQPVRAVLAARRASVRGLARAVGYSEGHLLEVINGYREPSDQLRTRVAEALGEPEETLFRPSGSRSSRTRRPGDSTLRRVVFNHGRESAGEA